MDWMELIHSPFEKIKMRYLTISDDYERMKIKQFLGNLFDTNLDDKEKCEFANKILKLNKRAAHSVFIRPSGDWWKQPEEPDRWFKCPKCGKTPEIWIFDNGCFAQCECTAFDHHESRFIIKIESIMSCVKRGALIEYGGEYGLMEEWNKYCRGELEELFVGGVERW